MLGLAACGGGSSASPVAGSASSSAAKLTYPAALRTDHVDDYHGEKVADPYRWLEDVDSGETKAWVEAENKLTFGYLEQIPQRAAIKERLTQLWNFERYGVPVKRGGKYFYTRNDGLQNQAVLYVADSLEAQPRLLLDPNTLLADGTAALVGWEPSEDGKLLAYGIAEAGSDWEIWRVRDVATGKDRADELKWVKWAAATFNKDASGIYYSRYDEPKAEEVLRSVNYFNKVYYHKLGDPQAKDKLVYEKPDQKEWIFGSIVTEDGRYLILNNWSGGAYGTNQILYRDLSKPNAPIVELLMGFDSSYTFIGNDGPRFWFMTELGAPRGRVVEIDVTKPDRAKWKTVIPEASEALEDVSVVGDRLVAVYLKDAASQVKSFALDGSSPRELKVPALSTLAGFHGMRSDPETFYSHVDFVHPGTIYSYNVKHGREQAVQGAEAGDQPGRLRNPGSVRHQQGRHEGADVHHRQARAEAGRQQSGADVRVRRLQDFHYAALLAGVRRVHGEGRHLRPAEPARRLRVRRGLAPGRHAREQAERVRRLHRLGAMADRQQVHADAETGGARRQQQRPADGSDADAAPRLVGRRAVPGRRAGHAALPAVHDRLGVGGRIRLVR